MPCIRALGSCLQDNAQYEFDHRFSHLPRIEDRHESRNCHTDIYQWNPTPSDSLPTRPTRREPREENVVSMYAKSKWKIYCSVSHLHIFVPAFAPRKLQPLDLLCPLRKWPQPRPVESLSIPRGKCLDIDLPRASKLAVPIPTDKKLEPLPIFAFVRCNVSCHEFLSWHSRLSWLFYL